MLVFGPKTDRVALFCRSLCHHTPLAGFSAIAPRPPTTSATSAARSTATVPKSTGMGRIMPTRDLSCRPTLESALCRRHVRSSNGCGGVAKIAWTNAPTAVNKRTCTRFRWSVYQHDATPQHARGGVAARAAMLKRVLAMHYTQAGRPKHLIAHAHTYRRQVMV